MLALATIGFAVTFWAWALHSPLAPKFEDTLQLSRPAGNSTRTTGHKETTAHV
jgi:nitrate/nitrite transporter NarK